MSSQPSVAVVRKALPLVSTAYPTPSGEAASAATVDPFEAGLLTAAQSSSKPSTVNGSTSPEPLATSTFSEPAGPATASPSQVLVISLGLE